MKAVSDLSDLSDPKTTSSLIAPQDLGKVRREARSKLLQRIFGKGKDTPSSADNYCYLGKDVLP